MYEGVITSVRTLVAETKIPLIMGLHQGSALISYLFTLVMDEPLNKIQDEVPMLFVENIVLINETFC